MKFQIYASFEFQGVSQDVPDAEAIREQIKHHLKEYGIPDRLVEKMTIHWGVESRAGAQLEKVIFKE